MKLVVYCNADIFHIALSKHRNTAGPLLGSQYQYRRLQKANKINSLKHSTSFCKIQQDYRVSQKKGDLGLRLVLRLGTEFRVQSTSTEFQ